ncbi:MAG: hypothetical protein RL531_1571 [Actinomycetota bacterium]
MREHEASGRASGPTTEDATEATGPMDPTLHTALPRTLAVDNGLLNLGVLVLVLAVVVGAITAGSRR